MRIVEMKNPEVDAAIMDRLEAPCDTFARLCDEFGLSPREHKSRIIDRALQRLRRAGRIKYENRKWVRVS